MKYQLKGHPIVYVDESGFEVDSQRTHGYRESGRRCYGMKDWHSRGRLNAIGAIIDFEFVAIDLWDCYINSDVFYAWLIQSLLPNCPRNSVIVLDNASFHKREDMIEAIEEAGHIIEFLPPYSPDLNPIERKWAQAKAVRKQYRCSPFEIFSYLN